MYIITNKKVTRAIENFVEKEVKNRDGSVYKTVEEKDKVFVEQFLNRFYRAFESLFQDKHFAGEIFSKRLIEIDAIRFDDQNKDLFPLRYVFDFMIENNKGNLDGGLFIPSNNHGVILLDMDFIAMGKYEGIHTLIHEMIHAMSLIPVYEKGKEVYKCGVNRSGKTFTRINEGITEYLAQKVWHAMYKNKTCPGLGGYNFEVNVAQMVINLFESEEQFFKDYFSNGLILQAQMRDIKNSQNVSLYEFIKSFDTKDFRRKSTQKMFVAGCDDFMSMCEIKK